VKFTSLIKNNTFVAASNMTMLLNERILSYAQKYEIFAYKKSAPFWYHYPISQLLSFLQLYLHAFLIKLLNRNGK